MKVARNTELEQVVKAVAGHWQPVSGGDPNTIDLWHHARRIEDHLQLQLPPTLPSKQDGVAMVELVERHFVAATLIRNLPSDALAQRAVTLADAIAGAGLQSGDPLQSYVCALYVWHGCINMAKLLRPTFNAPGGQGAYTDGMRTNGYAWLLDCWAQEMARGNPWVLYGVSLARLFEENRKGDTFAQMVIEDWVPPDSPYWNP
jgi:hypothetical protein